MLLGIIRKNSHEADEEDDGKNKFCSEVEDE